MTRNIHGVDLLFGQGEHTVTNSRIEAHGGTAGISVDTWFKTPGLDSCICSSTTSSSRLRRE